MRSFFLFVIDFAGVAAGEAAHGGNGPVPEIFEPCFERNAPDQISAAAQDYHSQGQTTDPHENVFQRLIHG